ncbi:MAG: phosphatidate cytidylyltransferase, partial [Ruminococcus sp.]|nr:phosphatidate cytidylyltransferase [Ruminococcus sp.]
MKSLGPRLLTAVIGIPLLLLILFLGESWPPIIAIAVGLASSFMIGEYLHAKDLLKLYALSIPCMAFPLAVTLLLFSGRLYILFFAFMIAAFSVILFYHSRLTYIDLAYSLFGTILITFGMSAIVIGSFGKPSFVFYFVPVFLLPWMADAGGFFIGAAFGKHKLCPNISPKKTVEGAVGGFVFCILSAVCMGIVFKLWITPEANINFFALVLLGAIDAPLSILGDLSFSLIKRSLNIKDYGSIFPGHGGFLDRFDSIIFTAPLVIVLSQFIPFLTVV